MWKLVTDIQAEKNAVKREVEERASAIIKELSQEVEGMNDKLKRYKLICFYCGVRMASETINMECELNMSKEGQL